MPVFLGRVDFIADWHDRGDVFAILELGLHRIFYLAARFLCLPFVDDVLERGDVVVLPYRVNAVMDCDVPYALAWEIKLRVLSCEDIVPAKP